MSGALVLLSGGLDSAVCYALARQDGYDTRGLFVDYGQPVAMQEWLAARAVAGEKLLTIRIEGVHTGDMDGKSCGAQVVPLRNAILVACAANVAAALGAGVVVVGCNADDTRDYADCRSDAINEMRSVVGRFGIGVLAPLQTKNKSEIKMLAASLGVASWWSCYTPGVAPCGVCASCRAND